LTTTAQLIRRRRQRVARRETRQTRKRAWIIVVALIVLLLVVLPVGGAVGATAYVYWLAVKDLPEPQQTVVLDPIVGATKLYDRSGSTLLYSVQDPLGNNRRWMSLDSLPPYVPQATLLQEDPQFLDGGKVDLLPTAARLWSAMINGTATPDSTLTGRLVRNTLLPSGQGPIDPTKEIALVAEIDRRYTPRQILEWLLNTDYYGNDAYGIDAAAQVYLGKTADRLTLDETAMLAAIPLAPQYNPFDNEQAARGRQQDVLRAMLRANLVTQPDFDQAINRLTPILPGISDVPAIAPDYALYAREQTVEILDGQGRDGARLVSRGGLRVTTALDLDLYYQTECAARTQIARLAGGTAPVTALDGNPCASALSLPPLGALSGDRPPTDGAVVIIDNATGELKTLVGNAEDRVAEPGPVLQPFVYITAFKSALYTPATMVLDVPQSFPGAQQGLIYTPANADGKYRGPMSLRDAMGAGLLPPAADVAYRQGMDNILRVAHQIGLDSLDLGVNDLSLLEKQGKVSLLDVAYAYTVFASLGNMRGVSIEPIAPGYRGRDPAAVLKITDADGNVLWSYDEAHPDQNNTNVLQAELAYLVDDVLADQQTRWPVLGENNVLDLPRTSAVVNGLTGDHSDDWTVGYTPHLTIGVHLARPGEAADSDGEAMTLDSYGVSGAASIWRAVMQYAHQSENLPADSWARPPGIVEQQVCQRSGLLPNGACPARTELFLDGTQSRLQPDTYWQSFQINSQTGQLATANTPSQSRSSKVYFVPPPEAYDWRTSNGLQLPPTEYDTVSRPELFGKSAILQPEPFAYIGGTVDVRGSIDTDDMQFYQLAYGQGLNPSEWIDIGSHQTDFQRGGSLGTWDTTGLDGLYNLRLSVVKADNSVESQIIQMTVDNVAPTIKLSAGGDTSAVVRYPGGVVSLQADVKDNLAITKVEFYHNGQFLTADTDWPYETDWKVEQAGTESFSATAFDAAGNSSSSQISVDVVRAG
jgi:membrane peptidoglycan carboxypeptidase